jgi:crossover junction endodeoxyribonuclease RuvC
MRILGIDPGLQLTGYGVIEFHPAKPKLIDAGVIRLNPKQSIAERLVELEKELDEIITEHKLAAIGVEQLYSHYAHPRTAILMGHARGVILLVAQRHGVAIHELAANRVKQSLTGCSGRSWRCGICLNRRSRRTWRMRWRSRCAVGGLSKDEGGRMKDENGNSILLLFHPSSFRLHPSDAIIRIA